MNAIKQQGNEQGQKCNETEKKCNNLAPTREAEAGFMWLALSGPKETRICKGRDRDLILAGRSVLKCPGLVFVIVGNIPFPIPGCVRIARCVFDQFFENRLGVVAVCHHDQRKSLRRKADCIVLPTVQVAFL